MLLCSPGLATHLIYSELIASHSGLFAAIVQLPAIPVVPSTGKPSPRLWKKICGSPFRYLLFNVVVVKLFSWIAGLSGHSIPRLAKRHGIEYRRQRAIDQEFVEWLEDKAPTWILNGSTSILRSDVLDIPSCGVLNYHCAPLPRFRGAANYFWLLAEKQVEAFGTLHYVDEGLDTGPIIRYGKTVPILPRTSVFELWKDVRLGAYPVFESVLPFLRNGDRMPAEVQDESLAQTRSFPTRSDVRRALIDGSRLFRLKDIGYILTVALSGVMTRQKR